MDSHARLALMRQDFERLLTMADPASTLDWHPSEQQRLIYIQLAERVLNEIDRFEAEERRKLLKDARLQSYVPDSLLSFVHQKVKPRVAALRATLDRLDPDGALVREMLDELSEPRKATGRVKRTFESGIEQIENLLDRNPDWEDDHQFVPETAYEVIDSKLIDFAPDLWLERADELVPIRTSRNGVLLPIHVRLRIDELYKAYLFGCWLSVLALSRSILEYAILDNLHKFDIDSAWPALGRDIKGKDKKLAQLIDEISAYLPGLKVPMDKVREYGNDYLHPKKSRVSKEMLLQRHGAAKDALAAVVGVVEALYLAHGPT